MKLYKNLINSTALILQDVFLSNRYADKALEKAFKQNPQWGSRDRRFVAEAVYDIVRYYRLYSELAESKKNFWFITAVWLVVKKVELPAWQEFQHVDANYILSQYEKLKNNVAIYESYPDWLWQLCEKELGKDNWLREAKALNETAEVVLRMNTLKTDENKFIEALEKENILVSKIEGYKNAYKLQKRENVFKTQLFKDGGFEVQDAGSQSIGDFVNPSASDFVVDACAGAGGKSLQLAAMMNNKGKIISLDVEEWKLDELKKRAKRAGAFNIEARLIEENKSVAQLERKADKVLLDVPCSGLGVLKRNPDSKWKLSNETIERTKILQEQILKNYCNMVKVGGSLFYSTCSILPSENRDQIDLFLANNINFEFIKEKNILPSRGYDGFYMCELKRTS
jgi:16S rRNA (cytosine967-C5)-methyltransferase